MSGRISAIVFHPTTLVRAALRSREDRTMKNWMIKLGVRTDIDSLLHTIKSVPKIGTSPEYLWQSDEITAIQVSFRMLTLADYRDLFAWIKKKLPRTEGTVDAILIKEQTSPLKFLYELLDDTLTKKKFHIDKDFKRDSYYVELWETFEDLLTRGLVNR